ncbi:MAG: hypothetical protein K8R68_04610 [Bacteroidales bacterium]|nr:hypothetical protein [Bacteroidales bacterium]
MRTFCFFLIILVSSLQGLTQEAFDYQDLCEKYQTWFASDTIKWTYEDSLVAVEYNEKLYKHYKPIKEFYFSGDYADHKIYEALHYDTTLLFYTLKLYAESKEEYNRQIGIPIGLAVNLINRDATIIGTVVDKINHYKECRFYLTTYFVRVDSVIFSYFPANIGDTILIHTRLFGFEGYCQANENLGFGAATAGHDYRIEDSGFCSRLSRIGYVRYMQSRNRFSRNYLDPFCTNSFMQYLGETNRDCMRDADSERILDFVKKIKKWY